MNTMLAAIVIICAAVGTVAGLEARHYGAVFVLSLLAWATVQVSYVATIIYKSLT